jgi:hypothetical protein
MNLVSACDALTAVMSALVYYETLGYLGDHRMVTHSIRIIHDILYLLCDTHDT